MSIEKHRTLYAHAQWRSQKGLVVNDSPLPLAPFRPICPLDPHIKGPLIEIQVTMLRLRSSDPGDGYGTFHTWPRGEPARMPEWLWCIHPKRPTTAATRQPPASHSSELMMMMQMKAAPFKVQSAPEWRVCVSVARFSGCFRFFSPALWNEASRGASHTSRVPEIWAPRFKNLFPKWPLY